MSLQLAALDTGKKLVVGIGISGSIGFSRSKHLEHTPSTEAEEDEAKKDTNSG